MFFFYPASLSERISHMGHEMTFFLAERLVKTPPNERPAFQSTIDFFETLLHRLLVRLLDQDNPLDVGQHCEPADSLYGLICCCPVSKLSPLLQDNI